MKKRLKKFFSRRNSMKIDAVKFGIAGGIISGLGIAISTIVGIFGYYSIHNSMVMEMYGMFGYGATWLGVLLGGIYGFVDGFIVVWLFAWIYNKLI